MHFPLPAPLRRVPGFRAVLHRWGYRDARHDPDARGERHPRLDPVGRRWRLRRGTTARLGLVTLLLLTAAGALYAGGASSDRSADTAPTSPVGTPPAPPGSSSPSPEGATIGPEAGAGWLQPRGGAPSPRAVPSGRVGVPVRLTDPTRLAGVTPGDRVDLYAVRTEAPERTSAAPGADGDGSPATGDAVPATDALVAEDALVLAVDRAAAALQLALAPHQGETVMAAPAGTAYAVVVRPRPVDGSGGAHDSLPSLPVLPVSAVSTGAVT